MTWGIDEVDGVTLVIKSNTLQLNSDATFSFDIHGIEILGTHITRVHRSGEFEHAISKR